MKYALFVLLGLFVGLQDASAQCNNTSAYGTAVAPTSGSVTISTCNFFGEYATISSVVGSSVYTSTVTNSGFITIRQGTPGGPVIASGNSPLNWTSTVGGNYYMHVNSNSACGSAFNCETTTIAYVGAANACSGTPNAGVVDVDSAACSSSLLNLTLTGSTIASGLTYQWQDSTAGGAWANIPGATNLSSSVSQTSATYYRCIVTCSGNSSFSDTAFVDQNPFYNCYCNAGATSTTYGYIGQTDFANVSYTSPTGCGQQYTNTGLTGLLLQGVPYTLGSYINSCTGTTAYSAAFKVWIDYNQNGSYADPGEEIFAINGTYFQTLGGVFTVPATAMTGITGMRIMVIESGNLSTMTPCSSFTWGEVEDYTVNIQSPPADDAGIEEIVSPVLPYCGGDSNVYVRLSNFGTDTLTSVDINLVINGGTPIVTSWTGSIPPLTVDTTIELAGTNPAGSFSAGDDIVVYTTLPNGSNDSLAANDTASLLGIIAGLSGVYNIPGDFATITGAVDTLNMIGTCDSTWFVIATGTYDEAVTITQFPRFTPDAPVIFRSATGNAADVIWETTTAPRVVNLDGADYMWFEDLTIKDTIASAQNAVYVGNAANFNKFENCHLIAYNPNFSSSTYSVYYDASVIDNGNMLINNEIEGGSYGMYIYGSGSTNLQSGTVITGNEIHDFYSYGMYLYYNENMTITHNEMHTASTYGSLRAVYSYYNQGQLDFSYNHIYTDAGSDGYYYPIYMSYLEGYDPINRGKITNNVVVGGRVGETGLVYGSRFYNATFKDFHQNTFINIDGNTTSYAFYASNNDVVEYKNNIYAVLPSDTTTGFAYGQAPAAYFTGGITLASDYNNYFSNNNNPIYFNGGYDLAGLQATGKDLNSFDVDPLFTDTVSGILCNDILDNQGEALGYMSDYIGNMRDMTTPDIGGVEFTGVSNFTLGPDSTICSASTVLTIGGSASLTWLDGNGATIGNGNSITLDQSVVMPVEVNFSNACGIANDDVDLTFVSEVSLNATEHLCPGDNVTLMPDGNGSSTASYEWFPTNETTPTVMIDEPGVYSVTKTEGSCVSNATITITQSESVELVDVEPCAANLPYTADATVNGGLTYNWSTGGTNATEDFSSTGGYAVTVTDDKGCTSEDSLNIEVIDIPSAEIALDSHVATLYFFNSTQSSDVGSNATYLWTFGDGGISSLENPSHNYSFNSTGQAYQVTLTITNACGSSETEDMQIFVDPLTVNELGAGTNYKVYPNPSDGLVNIQFAGTSGEQVSLKVIDVTGRVIATQSMNTSEISTVDLTSVAAGTYILEVNMNGNISNTRVSIK